MKVMITSMVVGTVIMVFMLSIIMGGQAYTFMLADDKVLAYLASLASAGLLAAFGVLAYLAKKDLKELYADEFMGEQNESVPV